MELSRISSTRMSSRTLLQPSTSRCKSDPQPYAHHRESTPSFLSRWDTTTALAPFASSSSVDKRSRDNLLKSLVQFPAEFSIPAIEAAERKRNQAILNLTKEIEKLSAENIQLKEETFEADYNFMSMIDQLTSKESEIENLRNELSQLSEEISLSTAKEEEYINNAKSCLHLEKQIETLQKQLSLQKKDFEELASAHAACPSQESIDSALEEVASTYKTCLNAANNQLSQRDRQIAELENRIARKDEELKTVAGELMKQQTDRSVEDMQRQELNIRLSEMDTVVQDRERLIAKMKTLMTRKSVKVNLLLLRIEELERKLEECQKQLEERWNPIKRSVSISNDQLGSPQLKKTWSLEDVINPLVRDGKKSFFHGAGDSHNEDDDSQDLLDETSKLQSDFASTSFVPSYRDILTKIKKIKSKIRHKLDKEIQKRSKASETIEDSRRRFDKTQLEIEEIRKHRHNAEDSRKQILSRVQQEQRLSKIIESSENESRSIAAKILSFDRAMKNLENLEGFIFQTENIQM
ncbi:hypothetical protein GE061_018319 [Apolygus lucorum]|uniref:Uncharacterized protein n=1 Tax=Apolygus lucorum TaxID=248454 RepID=A0A6A4IUV6_APOLU|nr:hypothetical protein GE061_018319 [Apolygus lucorum]